jgi:predicted lactoylglutathione lyase
VLVGLPQQISFVTIGARDVSTLRAFYRALGWVERPGSDDNFAAFDVGTTRLALYSLTQLREEAAPDEAAPADGWNGVTFGVNVDTPSAVDEAYRLALAVGARAIAEPVTREWGGYSGYVADPEGNRWELAWAPDL